jgi:hypothetical protein
MDEGRRSAPHAERAGAATRDVSKGLWGASSAACFRVDELLRQLIRWLIAAQASVAVGHAAMDAAIANYPEQRFTLRWDTRDCAAPTQVGHIAETAALD